MKRWTPEEYLEFERSSPDKHEYFQGQIFPLRAPQMVGGTGRHDRITGNVHFYLRRALPPGSPCWAHTSDMRVYCAGSGLYTYSDGFLACPPEYTDDKRDTVFNPCVIFEVLSPSTKDYDHGTKFENYRTIASLHDYVLLAQDKVLVEHYARQADGSWSLREYRAGEVLPLQNGSLQIQIDDLYTRAFE